MNQDIWIENDHISEKLVSYWNHVVINLQILRNDNEGDDKISEMMNLRNHYFRRMLF